MFRLIVNGLLCIQLIAERLSKELSHLGINYSDTLPGKSQEMRAKTTQSSIPTDFHLGYGYMGITQIILCA